MDNKKALTIQDLEKNPELRKNQETLKIILNQEPKSDWLAPHPFATKTVVDAKGQKQKVPVVYLPINRVEFMLDLMFIEWRVEVIGYQQLFNSVSVHVRVHYTNPVSGELSFHDGLGAVGIQTDKNAKASDLNAIKHDAVMKALPAAKSYAIKDAAEHLGKLFGRDLNRAEQIQYQSVRKNPEELKEQIEKLLTKLRSKLTPTDIESIESVLMEDQESEYKRILIHLKNVENEH